MFKRFHYRKVMASLRTSCHNLDVEVHRYVKKNDKNDCDKMCCKLCNSKVVEDEKHFLVHCPYYHVDRVSFLKSLNEQHSLLIDLKEPDTVFKTLFSYDKGNASFAKVFADFFDKMFELRQDFFEFSAPAFSHIDKHYQTRRGRVVNVPVRFLD